MLPIAFLLVCNRYQASDLVGMGHVVIAAIALVVGFIVVLRSRRHLSYGIGIATVPTSIIGVRMFWATIQFDLRDYPSNQLWLGLFSAVGPYMAVLIAYGISSWRSRLSNHEWTPMDTDR